MKLKKEKTVSFINYEFGDVLSQMNSKKLSMVELTKLVELELEGIIRQLYDDGYDTFVTGASIGFEMSAAKSILKIKEEYPNIKLVLVVTYNGEALVGYSIEEKQTYKKIYENAFKVVYPTLDFKGYTKENIITKGAYLLSQCSKIVVAQLSDVEKYLPETVLKEGASHLLIYTIDVNKPIIEDTI